MSDETYVPSTIPPHRVFEVALAGGQKRTVMAHMMSMTDDGHALIFHTWRFETISETPCLVQYCTDAFAQWDEAHEVQMPAVKTGKTAKTH